MTTNKNHKRIQITKCENKLLFVKAVIDATNCGLFTAKNMVDSMLKNLPCGTLLLNESSITVQQWEEIAKIIEGNVEWKYI